MSRSVRPNDMRLIGDRIRCRVMALGRVNSRSPSAPWIRPNPDSPTPPNGSAGTIANPTSTAAADVARRQRFRDQIDAYDSVLAAACAQYGPKCRYDATVHETPFGIAQLSLLDYFHPNEEGQSQLANLTYPYGSTGSPW